MTERSRGLPLPSKVAEFLSEDFARAGFEIEVVRIDETARPPRITVIADGDSPLGLDDIAGLSRSASDRLDAVVDIDGSYVLEVSSPGVDRPLTAEKHFRRAQGRRVRLTLTDGSQLTGRLGPLADGVLHLVIRAKPGAPLRVRDIALGDVVEGVVQVEFSTPSADELKLAGMEARR